MVGAVFDAVESYIVSLGKLSLRQQVKATQARALAKALDEADSGSGAKAASFELRILVDSLRDESLGNIEAGEAEAGNAQPSGYDEVKAARDRRLRSVGD